MTTTRGLHIKKTKNDYSTTLTNWGNILTSLIKLLKDSFDAFTLFNNGSQNFSYIRTLAVEEI